jgi:hypothetical protein
VLAGHGDQHGKDSPAQPLLPHFVPPSEQPPNNVAQVVIFEAPKPVPRTLDATIAGPALPKPARPTILVTLRIDRNPTDRFSLPHRLSAQPTYDAPIKSANPSCLEEETGGKEKGIPEADYEI